MTIAQAIARADALKPNQFSEAQKIQMLSDCDSAIYVEILQTHEYLDVDGATTDLPDFSGYASDVDQTTALIAPAPFDRLYISWLHSQYDRYNMENSRYNVTAAIFNAD